MTRYNGSVENTLNADVGNFVASWYFDLRLCRRRWENTYKFVD